MPFVTVVTKSTSDVVMFHTEICGFLPHPLFCAAETNSAKPIADYFSMYKERKIFFSKKMSNSAVRKRGKTAWNFEKSIMSNILRDERWQFFRKGVVDVST